MQTYFYNEDSQTENVLPFLLAASSSEIAKSGIVIMPQLRTKSESGYPASYFPFGNKVKFINNYSLPQISPAFNVQNVSIDGVTITTFYEYPKKDEIVETENLIKNKKIMKLFNILGKELFGKLNEKQLKFMSDTAGTVDLGESVNIQRMYEHINQY